MSSAENKPRILSPEQCKDIVTRTLGFARGNGFTNLNIHSVWKGNIRWARNQITTAGETLNNAVAVGRNIQGSGNRTVWINTIDDESLVAALRRAERLVLLENEKPGHDLMFKLPLEESIDPHLFSDTTYNLDATQRAKAARDLAQSSIDAGMLSAGYVEVAAHSQALVDSIGRMRYYRYTTAQYSVTVRDPSGSGSGWAGMDSYDWAKIDGTAISARALKKCLDSRNPVRAEPGRYTVILEPQAVGALVEPLVSALDRQDADSPDGVFYRPPINGFPRNAIGEKLIDERLTITMDPMDPDIASPAFYVSYWPSGVMDPFTEGTAVYHKNKLIEHGVVKSLAYDRYYAMEKMYQADGLSLSGSFKMTGGTTSIEQMISETARGVLVTRFDRMTRLDRKRILWRGYTRDGLWLIENGKITKAIQNFVFTESPLFALNKIEALGVPQRIFHPPTYRLALPAEVVVPPLKISDFSFTALSDAV